MNWWKATTVSLALSALHKILGVTVNIRLHSAVTNAAFFLFVFLRFFVLLYSNITDICTCMYLQNFWSKNVEIKRHAAHIARCGYSLIYLFLSLWSARSVRQWRNCVIIVIIGQPPLPLAACTVVRDVDGRRRAGRLGAATPPAALRRVLAFLHLVKNHRNLQRITPAGMTCNACVHFYKFNS